ncbi:hypothetical protein [Deinococcus multiflagellatus]|uniref:hypothetical protein n=1 Tax=Deinococcus multiflagellatus TaxID=1656887 RepID=UPI001CCC14EE|nr:hypothetical protein [Deinococcus multiflagellatus]MBZ9711959.1 hypothetical protein [Deinococcus multiflagellatus]
MRLCVRVYAVPMQAAIEGVRTLVEPLGWMVHVAGGFAVAFFASSVFSPAGRRAAVIARATAVVALLTVLGATWLVHPAAGMLLGYLGSHAFGRWRRAKSGLIAALVAAAVLIALGANWLVYPVFVMSLVWLASGAWGREERRAPKAPPAPEPAALPAQNSGTPLVTAPADGPLVALIRDERLPPDARAQLAALNLRTQEALSLLKTQGLEGSEAGYLTRAIREEYAPGAVNAYLKLPRSLADTAPIQEGKTGRALLNEQLELLLSGVQDVISGTLQSGSQELLTHGRFLRDRFAKVEADLRVPVEVKAK